MISLFLKFLGIIEILLANNYQLLKRERKFFWDFDFE